MPEKPNSFDQLSSVDLSEERGVESLGCPAQDTSEMAPEQEYSHLSHKLCAYVRILALCALGLSVFSGSEANAQSVDKRYQLLQRLSASDSGNFAPGQKKFSGISNSSQPLLFPSDNVSKKDKDKVGLDIPSPSLSFEAIKRLQSSVSSRYGLIKRRLEQLSYIKRNAKNFEDAENPEGPLHAKHKSQKKVYDNEHGVNTKLEKLWKPIKAKLASLRKEVKGAVILEAKICKSRKRCAKEQKDIDSVEFTYLISVKPRQQSKYNTYNGSGIPPAFSLEPFQCADTSNACNLTNSQIIENAKFLEKVAQDHLAAVCKREEAYLQIEDGAKGLKGASNAGKKRGLVSIYKGGRSQNDKLRRVWTKIIKGARAVKKMIVKAEAQEAKLAGGINRCMTK